jgi:hypothetical protein
MDRERFCKSTKMDRNGLILQLKNEGEIFVQTRKVTSFSKLLEELKEVFNEPKELPPSRSYDHLKEGTKPVSVRPCPYPYYHKIEIEKKMFGDYWNQESSDQVRVISPLLFC